MKNKTYIDVNQVYRDLKQRGYPVKVSKCCGRDEYRKDYQRMLQLLGKTGSFIIKSNGVIVAIVDV